MTEAEFKEAATPIFAAGPNSSSTEAMRALMRRANETIPVNRLAILAAEALDEAYPAVVALKKLMGEPTAAERMAVEVARGGLKDRLDPLN